MPFAKRVVEPRLLCRSRGPAEEQGPPCEDLASVSSLALTRTLRQLSALAQHASSVFQELEVDLAASSLRLRALQGRIGVLQETCSDLDPKQEAVPVSTLDVESKLTTHYQAAWCQQRDVLHPSTRPPCVEELHRQASFSLWALQQGHQRRRSASRGRRVTISISSLPPLSPLSPPQVPRQDKLVSLTTFDSTPSSSSPIECCRFAPWSRKAAPSDLDPDGGALGQRSKFPVSNIPSTLDKQTNWTKALPLPTPEERMKCNSQVITSCVIPINVTGLGFDRDASVRCSLVHSQSLLQRRRKLRRRRTVAGVPRQVQQDLDSDESPGSRERTVRTVRTVRTALVPSGPGAAPFSPALAGHLNTRDSGCQTEDFLTPGAPSRRRIRAQRGPGVCLALSRSAGNISSLPDGVDAVFGASLGLRSRSLPRGSGRRTEDGGEESDDDEEEEEEEELSPFGAEDFLPGPMELILTGGEARADGQLKYQQRSASPERGWMERSGSRLPRQPDLGSCEISSSSDTFGSPVHSVSAAGVLGGPMDHKDDHQSSSGNWSGSSSTCPSQTSETLPPAASPPLTGSSHCDSELSLNAAGHAADDQAGFLSDPYQGLRAQRAGSFSSTAMDILEEVGVGAPVDGDWSYGQPEPGGGAESSLGCPSFTSMATCESSFSDKPPSEKADTVSHYSVDTEGYYTSMHFDCGLKGSRSFTYSCAPCGSDRSLSELGGHVTLGRRCLSLRKAKARPSPPKRSSSLRKICSEGNIPDKKEPKISCGQQRPLSRDRRLQLRLSGSPGPAGASCVPGGPSEVWGAESCTDFSDLGVLSSTEAHSFKDDGAVQADYADLWLLNDLRSGDPYRSLSNSSTATGTTVVECVRSQESSESQTSPPGSGATTPSLPSVDGDFKLASPERLAGLASPSSGYSSQSETPTSSFPSAFFPGPLSPASGKRKPKVPERKSSLPSLSLRPPSSCDPDLEPPAIPPPHLDLSALHGGTNKASAFRTQIQNLHQHKQKLAPPAKHFPPSSSEVFSARPWTITPSALHAVQLRSVSKDVDDQLEAASRLHPPSGNTPPIGQSAELQGPSPYGVRPRKSPKDWWDSFTSSSDSTSGCEAEPRSRPDPEPPSGGGAAAGLQSEPSENPAGADVPETPAGLEDEGDKGQELVSRPEDPEPPSEDGVLPPPPSLAHGWSGVQEAPAADGESEAVTASPVVNGNDKEGGNDSSGVLAQSGRCDDQEATEERSGPACRPGGAAAALPLDEPRPEDDGVFLSPSKARTTEDLFAMIHRSKRKVLGRKDSDPGVRNRLGASPGNTPPGSAVSSPVAVASPPSPSPPPTPSAPPAATPPASQRVSGPIYRNAKKSSTSSEEFKLLLLRKGSRSDSSYRMSATEILKSPGAPRSPGDPGPPGDPGAEEPPGPEPPSGSPYPRANTEGFSPRASPAASRPGRSRIPPPASSSRFGGRGRLFSPPMQAISEGEAENSDGSPQDERSSRGST